MGQVFAGAKRLHDRQADTGLVAVIDRLDPVKSGLVGVRIRKRAIVASCRHVRVGRRRSGIIFWDPKFELSADGFGYLALPREVLTQVKCGVHSGEPAGRNGATTRSKDRKMAAKTCWTADDVRALGLVTSLETAGQILGIGRSKAYEMARQDEFPVKVMRVGRCYRVVVPAILAHLGAG